ncbi:MAG: DUF2155 domain-containing protein [Alphaproteobacteria bacterium]|nr:DUF2155 domain-containing protein [Alphaproteobacteria bacterium]
MHENGRLFFWALGFVAAATLVWPRIAVADRYDVTILQGLDKITARVSTIEAPVNETTEFGSLHITPRACDKRPPEEPPESAAFVEISDTKPGQERVDLFSGWMFASSPGLSALEHPVYVVWVLDCKNAENSASDSSE